MFTPPPTNQVVGGSACAGVPCAQVAPASTQSNNLNNPFLDPTNQAAYQIPTVAVPAQSAMTNGAVHSVLASSNPPHVAQQLHISTQPSADDLECFIPGCGKPVHVDAKGMKTSDYCSMRHREYVISSFFFFLSSLLFISISKNPFILTSFFFSYIGRLLLQV
jgi:hypothetical protein